MPTTLIRILDVLATAALVATGIALPVLMVMNLL